MTCDRVVTLQPMQSANDKTSAYRDRQREEDAWRLQVYLPAEYRQLVSDTAARLGVTNKAAIQFLMDTGGIMYEDLTPELALKHAPTDKARELMRKQFIASGVLKDGITPAEQADLEQFKLEVAGQNVTERQVMIAGGADALAQKARVSESWLSGNVHQQGGK